MPVALEQGPAVRIQFASNLGRQFRYLLLPREGVISGARLD